MKIFTKGVYILCSNRKNLCNLYFLCLRKCVATSGNISCSFKERATAPERYLENVQLSFEHIFCVWLLLRIFHVF